MRIIHTIASTRLDHGGTSRSVPAMCDALAEWGADVHLVAGRPADAQTAYGWLADAQRLHAVGGSQRPWAIGLGFRRKLAALCNGLHGDDAVLHDHGVWLATNHATAAFARRRKVVRVVSPHGMLSAWAMQRSALKKRLAWRAYQRRDLASATAFHATSDDEAAELRRLGLAQPIVIVPNGVACPAALERTAGHDGRRTMLFLSRIHPKKGLVNLVRAWRAAAPGAPWRLVIAGPDECGHRAEVEREVAALGLASQVSLCGELDDAKKWQAYAAADVFVLPSFSENFGLVVTESLAAGTPVITTTGTPWRELREREAGWHVEPTVAALGAAIAEATAAPRQQLEEMGRRGSTWVREQFTWQAAAKSLLEFYNWLLDRGPAPACILP